MVAGPNEYTAADFEPSLIARCASLIAGITQSERLNYHNIFWHPKTMTIIIQITETNELLKRYNRAWRESTRVEAGNAICAILMAVEILVLDLNRWGTAHPAAKSAAEHLLGGASEDVRTRILKIFKVIDADAMGPDWQNAVKEVLALPH